MYGNRQPLSVSKGDDVHGGEWTCNEAKFHCSRLGSHWVSIQEGLNLDESCFQCILVGASIATKLNRHHTCFFLSRISDAHEVVDYLNFGGRLGTGQPCKSGLDCATGACSKTTHRCHCQICEEDNNCTSGCISGETCVDIKEVDGVHGCMTNVSGVVHIVPPSNSGEIRQFQGPLLFILQALVMLRIFAMR